MTDEILIQRASRGEPGAARQLYRRHAGRVHAVVRRVTGDEEAAGDCCQETWIRIFDNLESFRGEASFGSWAHRIAVNTTLDWLRREGPRRSREGPLSETLASGPRRGDALLAARLERALDRVPLRQRTVLVLHDVEGWTHREIAEALGIEPGTSKSQLHRARARMRELLPDPSELAVGGAASRPTAGPPTQMDP
ncbi:MAG: sigma-70 family RNA polymerase sigma factor [Gemmatimonadales bacterium]|nr:MAG: sigma-70 family RNA polymerase sigma factor [Gemmatimonadales bacterium]